MSKFTEDMGYVYISEATSNSEITDVDRVQVAPGVWYVVFNTNLQDFDVENRNHRYYKLSNVKDKIENDDKIQSCLKANGWFGEFDHPAPEKEGEKLSRERICNVPPKKRAFKIMDPHFSGNILKATIQSAQGEVGTSFRDEILAGWIAQFSLRAIAVMTNENNKPYVSVKKVITYDAPWYPSHKVAHQTSSPEIKVVSESAGLSPIEIATEKVNDVIIPLKDILTDISNTDPTVQTICEAFDIPFENMSGFTPNKDKVIIKDENNIIYANINPNSVKRVSDFFNSF